MVDNKFFKHFVCVVFLVVLLTGCNNPATEPATQIQEILSQTPTPLKIESAVPSPVPTAMQNLENQALGLSEDQVATLSSLEMVADYPLYTMHYYGSYQEEVSAQLVEQLARRQPPAQPRWGCSLFAALGDAGDMLYGRNFDWEYSPALLLYTDPPNGFASASMVDLAYLFETSADIQNLTALPLTERLALLETPAWPFDGINEMGLVVGMAAVPSDGNMQTDLEKDTIYSLPMIREMLDNAANVDEAISLLGNYNIIFGGPPLHYLLADSSGRSALVEFYNGEMLVTYNEQPWQMATNFLCAVNGECTEGKCWRYDTISEQLQETQGRLKMQAAMDLLAEVSQEGTQWSILYGLSTGEINVALGKAYDQVHKLHLEP